MPQKCELCHTTVRLKSILGISCIGKVSVYLPDELEWSEEE